MLTLSLSLSTCAISLYYVWNFKAIKVFWSSFLPLLISYGLTPFSYAHCTTFYRLNLWNCKPGSKQKGCVSLCSLKVVMLLAKVVWSNVLLTSLTHVYVELLLLVPLQKGRYVLIPKRSSSTKQRYSLHQPLFTVSLMSRLYSLNIAVPNRFLLFGFTFPFMTRNHNGISNAMLLSYLLLVRWFSSTALGMSLLWSIPSSPLLYPLYLHPYVPSYLLYSHYSTCPSYPPFWHSFHSSPSRYNRGGVERVMGFCTDEEYQEFMHSCPIFENVGPLSFLSYLYSAFYLPIPHLISHLFIMSYAFNRFNVQLDVNP